MSVNDTMIRSAFAENRRRMRSYPEGDSLFWRIVEFGFVLFCIGCIAACALIAGGVK